MKISGDNYLLGGTVTDDIPEVGQDANDIISFSGERVYLMEVVSDRTLTLTLPSPQTLNYVGLVCDAGAINATVTIYDENDVPLVSHPYSNNRPSVLMFEIPTGLYSAVKIKFTGPDGLITVIHAAAGVAFEVPNNGEQSGYNRNWLKKSFEQRATENKDGYPVASTLRRVSLPGVLSIPNAINLFAETVWRPFQDFAVGGAFFIQELSGRFDSSYLCFNAEFEPPKAHSSTDALVSLSVRYRVYTGN